MKRIKLTPLLNFSKLLDLPNNDLKLETYKHEVSKTKNCKFSCRVSNENLPFGVQNSV